MIYQYNERCPGSSAGQGLLISCTEGSNVGLEVRMFHLIYTASPGSVRRGQHVGSISPEAADWCSTGPHLDFTARYNGAVVDPEYILDQLGCPRPNYNTGTCEINNPGICN